MYFKKYQKKIEHKFARVKLKLKMNDKEGKKKKNHFISIIFKTYTNNISVKKRSHTRTVLSSHTPMLRRRVTALWGGAQNKPPNRILTT